MKTAIAFLLVVALIATTIDAAIVFGRTPKEEHVNSRMKKASPEDPIGARVTRQLNCCEPCYACSHGVFSNYHDDGCPDGQKETMC